MDYIPANTPLLGEVCDSLETNGLSTVLSGFVFESTVMGRDFRLREREKCSLYAYLVKKM